MKKLVLFAIALILATTPALAAGNLSVGTLGATPILGFMLNENIGAAIGGTYNSTASTYTYLIALSYNLAKVGEVQTSVGLAYASGNAAAQQSTTSLSWGVGTLVQPNLGIGLDFILASSQSPVAATSILPAASLKVAYIL